MIPEQAMKLLVNLSINSSGIQFVLGYFMARG